MATKTVYGHFDDAHRRYVVTNPLPPAAWINYLGNRRLGAFISQAAGGLMWYLDTLAGRITRYGYVATPSDRPGFYVYIKDRRTGSLWNPSFSPTLTKLDKYECRHEPGITSFASEKDGVTALAEYTIPQEDNALIWKVTLTNTGKAAADLQVASYIEFGILELYREFWWAYLQKHISFNFDHKLQAIAYNYGAYEAAIVPRIYAGCTDALAGFECARDVFLGRGNTLQFPAAMTGEGKLSNSELPLGGHGVGVLGVDVKLAPGQSKELAYIVTLGDTWEQSAAMLQKYRPISAVTDAINSVRKFWDDRLGTFDARTGDEMVDRFVNTWNGYQSMVLLAQPASITTEHGGVDGLHYRDLTQYALTPANLDPPFAAQRLELVLSTQKQDGLGNMSFWPHTKKPIDYSVRRSDNTVWQIYTLANLVNETGDLAYVDKVVPFVDGGQGSVYEHVLRGLKLIYDNRGPQGMPLMFFADWNDGLEKYAGPETESVMLGMQLVYSCQLFKILAERLGRTADAAWCEAVVRDLTDVSNSDRVWDGKWYRRLMLGGGSYAGGAKDREGKIWINSQTWAVICGAGQYQNRGKIAMQSVKDMLDSPAGLFKQYPPLKSVPDENGQLPPGAPSGIGEYGGIFNHSNTWAIMAETLLGHNERAFEYYRRTIPAVVSDMFGADHYIREPYVYVSAVVGPIHKLFGEGGISWQTGTASWMYHAATQYILGIRPTLDGLMVTPCLPSHLKSVRLRRRFRGCEYDIQIDNAMRGKIELEVNGRAIDGKVVPVQTASKCSVRCRC